jgi:hypothetical protein
LRLAKDAVQHSIVIWANSKAASEPQVICETMNCLSGSSMQEWTDEFITNAQQELVGMVKDWKYDYGADDKACSAMLLWMVLKLNPQAEIDSTMLQCFDQFPC